MNGFLAEVDDLVERYFDKPHDTGYLKDLLKIGGSQPTLDEQLDWIKASAEYYELKANAETAREEWKKSQEGVKELRAVKGMVHARMKIEILKLEMKRRRLREDEDEDKCGKKRRRYN